MSRNLFVFDVFHVFHVFDLILCNFIFTVVFDVFHLRRPKMLSGFCISCILSSVARNLDGFVFHLFPCILCISSFLQTFAEINVSLCASIAAHP